MFVTYISAIMQIMTATIEKISAQFITNEQGERIAVILPIALYEQIKPMLQTAFDTERDDDGEIRPEVRQRLLQQLQAVEAGERGTSLNEAMEDAVLIHQIGHRREVYR